jgi:GT2 family glycosyltransferase
MQAMIDIVSATRLGLDAFWSTSPLGLSLQRLSHDSRLARAHVAYENRRGLPEIYNERIAAADSSGILVFVHDDVWIDDYFLADRILAGLQDYDVIGLAGNRRRKPSQPGWAFVDDQFTWDDMANLSGAIAHGKQPFGALSAFGPVPADCELLDGVFLAAKTASLRERQVAFDPRFDFHFYDMDFCRSARRQGLRLGTWPICMTHQSDGAFGSEAWRQKYRVYLEKWDS